MLKHASFQGLRAHQHLARGSCRCRRTLCAASPAYSIKEIQKGLRSRQLSAVDIIDQYTENIVNSEPVVNSLLSVQFEGAVRKVYACMHIHTQTHTRTSHTQGPLSRFGDTAANTGTLALLEVRGWWSIVAHLAK